MTRPRTQRARRAALALGLGLALLAAPSAFADINGFAGGDADQTSANCAAVQDWQCLDPADIVGAVDGTGATDDTFAGGSKEHLPNTWAFVTESVQAKADLRGVWTATESSSDGRTFLNAAFLRTGAKGDTYLGIELNQSNETWVNPLGATIPCRTDGDVLISYEVGNSPLIKLYEWAGTGPAACPDGATGTWNGGSSLLLGGEAAVNMTAPITNYLDTAVFGNTFGTELFGEAALDLRAIADVVDYPGTCAYFRQITVKSRSSSEVTSTLQDWVQGQDALARSCETPGGGPPPVDVTPPAPPTLAGPAQSCLSGITLSGTAEPGSTVSVFEGEDFAGFAEVAGDGTWSLLLSGLGEGTHVFTADATDDGGNTSTSRSPAVQVTVDLTAPAAPTLSASSTEAGVVVLSGTTLPGAEVTLLEGGVAVATAVADASGAFSSTLNGVETGQHSYTARVSDGCRSSTSQPAAVTVAPPPDVTPPAAPTLAGPAQSCQSGLTLSGTGEPGATVKVYDGEALAGSTEVAGDGTWSLALSGLTDGTHSFTAAATDDAENTSPRSPAVQVTVDATAPAAPTLSASAPQSGTVVLSGTADPGAQVTLLEGITTVATVVADQSGAFSATLTDVSIGDHTYTARAADGCRSTASQPATVNVPEPPDTTAPAAPTLAGPADSCTADVTLSGTGEPGATINVYDGDDLVGSTDAAGDGSWTLALTDLSDGTHSFTADATDDALNTSPRSPAVEVAVDLTAPAAPTLSASSTESGVVVLSGTTVPGAQVTLLEGLTTVATVTAGQDGAFSATLNSVSIGEHTYRARVADGCRSTSSAPATVNVPEPPDTAAPAAPTLAGPDSSCQADVTLSGTGEPGATINVYDGDDLVGSTDAAGDGSWSLPLTDLSDGTHSFTADATDDASNTSPRSPAVEVAVDLTAPAAPTLSASSTESGVVVLSGTTAPGTQVTLLEGGTTVATVTAGQDGAFTATLNDVSTGDHTYTARVADDCRSTASQPATVNVDASAPAAPTLAGPADSCTADVTLSGTGEPGSTINVYEGEDLVGSTDVAGDGSWSLPLTDLSDGTHSFTADATDDASNTSPRSPAVEVAVDLTAPAAPTLSASSPQPGTVVLSGTAAPGAQVTLLEGTTTVATVTAGQNGAFSRTLTGVSTGAHTYTARVADDCRSSASLPAAVTVAGPPGGGSTGETPPTSDPKTEVGTPPVSPPVTNPVTPPTADPTETAISEVYLGETPEAAGCALKPFKAYVQRKRVRKVRYMVDGKLATVTKRPDSIGRFVGLIDPVALALGAGQHNLTARVFFRKSTGRKPVTLNLRFRRCDICLSRRSFKIRVKNLRNGERPIRAKVFVNGKKVRVIKGKRLRSRVVLKGLPKGTYNVVIKARTNRGRVVTDTRRYRTCVPKNAPK